MKLGYSKKIINNIIKMSSTGENYCNQIYNYSYTYKSNESMEKE